MSKNRLYLFLIIICFGLITAAWNVAAKRNFMELALPQEEPPPIINCQEAAFNFTKIIDSNNANYIFSTDFNRDGKLDVVLASPNQLTFFLNDGSGELVISKTVSLADAKQITSITEADFNQDSNPDYLVTKDSGLSILLNDGLGSFSVNEISKQTFSIVASADFNLDGKEDFVGGKGKDLSVFLGDGVGNFSEPIITESPVNIEWLLVNEFSLDASKDIVVIGENKVVTFLGDKTGNFSTFVTNTLVNPKYAQTADFNQDGKLDLVIIDDNAPIFAQILLNKGNGAFIAGDAINTTLNPSAKKTNRNLVVGDFNQDGKADFVISNAAPSFDPILEPTFARMFIGDGKGGVSYGGLLGSGNARDLVATGDFNSDGKLDLARASNGGNNFEINFSGTSAGCINPSFISLQSPASNGSPKRSAVADFNNDGRLDVITINSDAKNLSRLFGSEQGNLTAQIQIPLTSEPADLIALDFNQDGKEDLAIANRLSNNVNLLMGDGDGNFNPVNNFSLGSLEPLAIKTGDFNLDGKADLLVASNNGVALLINREGKSFTQELLINITGDVNSLEVTDFNRDGKLDFIVGKSDGSDLSIFLGDGKGKFARKNILASCGISPRLNSVGDFNRDGFQDLLVSCNAGSNKVLLGDTAGQFTSSISLADGQLSTFGDFNNDGNLDVLVYVGENQFSLVLGDGTGKTKSTVSFSTGFNLSNVASINTGDFNQDGKLDFLVTDRNNNLVSLVLNICTGSSSKLIEKGNSQRTGVGNKFAVPLEVKVVDVLGNGVSDVVVDFEAPKTTLAAGGSFPNGANKVSVKTNSEGIAIAPVFTANNFAGEHTVTATVVNDAGIRLCGVIFNLANQEGSIAIIPANGAVPDAVVGVPYNFTFNASGGMPPYSFSLLSSSLPSGLSLSPSGMITGTPDPSPSIALTFDVQVMDSLMMSASGSFSINVLPDPTSCPPINIAPMSLPDAEVGVPYSAMLNASGGAPPYIFSADGLLPGGLTLNSDGSITGTPVATGFFTFNVKAIDMVGCEGSSTVSLNINSSCPPIVISPPTLPNAMVGTPYNQTLTASGGIAPYNFTIVMGSLPPGLNLSQTGTITGTPIAGGPFSFTVQAEESGALPKENIGPLVACTGIQSYTITVMCPPLDVSPTSLPNAMVGVRYGQSFTVSGGTPPYSIFLSSGTLPPGLSFDGKGTLLGTPVSAGIFNFNIGITDASGCGTSRPYSIVVCGVITISPPNLPDAIAGTPYNQALMADGGNPPYNFSLAAGSLPPGLNLSPSGMITGTPMMQGSFDFTVQATDVALCMPVMQSYTIVVNCATITITPPVLFPGTIAVPYNQMLGATGGLAPYTFLLLDPTNTLPPGLNLNSNGSINGTPTSLGTFLFNVQATDVAGCSTNRAYAITITCPLITVNPPSLPSATVGINYNQTLGATGGTPPYAFSVASGSTLPQGLSLTPSGTLSGAPAATGTFGFTVQTTDNNGCSGVRNYSLVVGECPSITITPPVLLPGTVGVSYSQTISATGGVAPYDVSLLDGSNFPPGLLLDKSGLISGVPKELGTFLFFVRVTDRVGCFNTRAYAITIVSPCSPFTFTPTILPNASIGTAYSQTINVTGGKAPYNFSADPTTLPPGLTIQNSSPSTATLLGTPLLPGTFTFTVNVTDSTGASENGCTGSQTYTVTVLQPCGTINILPSTLPDAPVNSTYNQALTASGGTGPYTFSIASGTLPTGLTLNQNGVLSGTPTVGGTFNFIVQAKDINNCTGNRNYTLTISSTPGTIGFSASSFTVTEGGRLSVTISRTNGSTGQVSVTLGAQNGSAVAGREFASVQGTVTFNDGDSSAKTVTIQTNANNLVEPNKSFTLTLSSPTGGARLGTATANVTITEKDPAQPGSLAFTQPNYIISETGGSAVISIVRLNGGNIPISVTYSTSPGLNAVPGVNYIETRGTLNFLPGANIQSFNIPVINDNQTGANKIVNINLSNPTGGATLSGGFATLVIQEVSSNPAQLKVDLQDIDFGSVNIGNSIKRTVTVTNTGGQELNFNPVVSAKGVKILGNPTTRLLASQSATFDMSFDPIPGSLGLVSGMLNITSNGGNAAIKINARSIDTVAPKMTFDSLKGGELITSGTQFKIPFTVVENDALNDSTLSFAAILADGRVMSGDIARLDGQSRIATWNVPIDLESSSVKISLRSNDRASNSTILASGIFSIRRAVSTAPILETLITFTPPTESNAAPTGLKVDAKESASSIAITAPDPVLSVQINFQPPTPGQVAPPRNVTVRAEELKDKNIAQLGKVTFSVMPKVEGDVVIAGYNVYRVPQNEDGSMPSADEIVKEENLVTTLPPNATGFNDKVSTNGSSNFTYSVSTFFGNGQMSSGSQPMGTNLPVIINPMFSQGTVFLESAGSFIKQGATLIINDTETYNLQFDNTGTRFTVPKKQASMGNSFTIKRLIGKASIVRMIVKNSDGTTSVGVMFSRKGIVKTLAQNVKRNLNIEPKADTPAIAGYNIYRAPQPIDGTILSPEEIIKPENLIGSIPGNMTMFMDKVSTSSSGSGNFTYSVSTFFGNGQMSSGSQPASTDLPVIKNPKFEDKSFFVDSAGSFIKPGATLIINDTEMYTLEFDDTGTRFTTRRKVGSPSNQTIDQFIKKGDSVRLTIKNADGKLSVGVNFKR